jgi:hypothetical protein
MFELRELLAATIFILLFSCNSTDKQKGQVNSPGLTDTGTVVPQNGEINLITTKVIENKPVASKFQRTQKTVSAKSNLQAQTLLENEFKKIEPGFQDFLINSDFDTTLLCREGTVFKIKHSSFLIASNLKEVNGIIKFQVKEFYNIPDIISARLATNSSQSILETAGMIFIQATADGQLCKLKEKSAIEVSFPYTEKKDSMFLFTGSWTNKKINWELFPLNEARQKDIIEKDPAFPGGTVALQKFLNKNLVYPDSLADLGIGGIIQIGFVIDETGKAKTINFKNPSHNGFKETILKAFSKMPNWKPATRNGVPVKSTYSQLITFNNVEQSMNDTIFKYDFEERINDIDINKVKTADIRQYIFSTSKLGWINCDRFYNSSKPMTSFYVDCGKYTELDIKLVFHSFKAILDGYPSKAEFQNIPGNEAITVVVVKKINNETFISLTKSNTNSKSLNNLAFEKVTIDKLKQKLEQLNNLK